MLKKLAGGHGFVFPEYGPVASHGDKADVLAHNKAQVLRLNNKCIYIYIERERQEEINKISADPACEHKKVQCNAQHSAKLIAETPHSAKL